MYHVQITQLITRRYLSWTPTVTSKFKFAISWRSLTVIEFACIFNSYFRLFPPTWLALTICRFVLSVCQTAINIQSWPVIKQKSLINKLDHATLHCFHLWDDHHACWCADNRLHWRVVQHCNWHLSANLSKAVPRMSLTTGRCTHQTIVRSGWYTTLTMQQSILNMCYHL